MWLKVSYSSSTNNNYAVASDGTSVMVNTPLNTGKVSFRSAGTEKAFIDNTGGATFSGNVTVNGGTGLTATNGLNANSLIGATAGQLGLATTISDVAGTVGLEIEVDKTGGGTAFANDVYIMQVISVQSAAPTTILWGLDRHGIMFTNTTTTAAATATVTSPAGKASITAGSTITLTLTGVTANDLVFTQVIALGTGPTKVSTAACTANTITITMDAATTAGTTTVGWYVIRKEI
jgi:hypothetical protein